MDEIRVLAPATVSNVVCGFDCLGFALKEPYDEISVRKIPDSEIRIINRDEFDLPTEAARNVAGVALRAMLDTAGAGFGIELESTKHIKPGSGIGSSSASSCGAVAAANRLLGDRFSKSELVEFAMEGEKLASGAKHADNVAPCIFGGFVLVRSVDPLDVVPLDFPPVCVTVIHPQIEIKTADARAILPKDVALGTAVRQWSNLGAFVAALAKADYELLARSMQDLIVEPTRKSLIPEFEAVKAASIEAGSLGGGISGSGPSMFMLSKDEETARNVEAAVQHVYSQTGIEFKTYISAVNAEGIVFV